jgi:hypothetical protein
LLCSSRSGPSNFHFASTSPFSPLLVSVRCVFAPPAICFVVPDIFVQSIATWAQFQCINRFLKPLACIWFGLSGVGLAATGAPLACAVFFSEYCSRVNVSLLSRLVRRSNFRLQPDLWLCDTLFLLWHGFLFGPVLFSSNHHSSLCFLWSVPTKFWRWLLCSCFARALVLGEHVSCGL